MGVIRRRSGTFVIHVDPVACDGYGHCHELAPDLIALDEWGYPIMPSEVSLSDHRAYESAKYAERGCPRQALRIERRSEVKLA